MKKFFMLFIMLCLSVALFAQTYDFVAVSGSNTLKYIIKGSNNVSVVGLESGRGQGDLVIPRIVTNGGTPYSVTEIGDNAFQHCNGFTGSLTIPNSVIVIGENAFAGCIRLSGNLTIPNSVITIDAFAFAACYGITGVLTIGSAVRTIGASAFYNCSNFTGNLTIPNSVISIGLEAFRYCSSFESLTVGNSVIVIGIYAFSGCTGFNEIVLLPSIPPRAYSNSFEFAILNSKYTFIKVACSTLELYKNNSVWNVFDYYKENRIYDFIVLSDNDIRGGVEVVSTSDCNSELYTVSFKAVPTKGFVFLCWNDGNTNIERTITLTQDSTIIASFDVAYTIEYDANGGLGRMSSQVVAVNKKINLESNEFTKEGYEFKGWSDIPVGEAKYMNMAEVAYLAEADEIITLYAIWNKKGEVSNELANEIKFSIYPNPVSTVLTVEATTEVELYRIYNLQGLLQDKFISNGLNTEISVKNLSSGVYFLQAVKTNSEVITIRFIKK